MPLYIQDTADVTLKRKSDGFTIATGTTQSASISQTVEEEAIKGGIGNGTLYTIKSGKEIEISVTDATFSTNWLAATQGVKVLEDQTVKVLQTDRVEVEAGGKVTLKDSAYSGSVVVSDKEGKNFTGEATAGELTVPDLEVGSTVAAVYEKDVTGQTIPMRSDKFAEKYKAQLFTYAYDMETEAIVKDVYILFENVTPSSEFEMGFEAGSAFTPEMTLKASLDTKTREMGNFVFVDHEEV